LLRSIALQLIFFIIIFNLASWFRESSMLANDTPIAQNNYQVQRLNGESLFLQAQGKTTVLYFFAPWCQICNLSIENLEAIHQKNKNIDIIAVALDYADKKSVVDFAQRHQLTFPVVYGTTAVKTAFKIKAYPSYYIIDKENTIIGRSLGYSTEMGLYLRTL